ncbi:MAG: hypothetical protein VXZ38_09950 [Planctomycetota bacterium]|nr:hypothetical protein [Planctomycetota bacterium]
MTSTYKVMLIALMVGAVGINTTHVTFGAESGVETSVRQVPSNESPLSATVRRGLSGSVRFTHRSSAIEVRANQSVDEPVLVRLELMGSKSDLGEADTIYEYMLRFFGMQAGTFDLSQMLTIDGQTQSHSDNPIEAIWVEVVSELPLSRGTNLYEIADPEIETRRGYRVLAYAFGLIWCSIPVVVWASRGRDRTVIGSEPIEPPLTHMERLQSLANDAVNRPLSSQEHAEFEWLLYSKLLDQSELTDSLLTALPVLKMDQRKGAYLRRVERWLHSADSVLSDSQTAGLAELLSELKELEEQVRDGEKGVQEFVSSKNQGSRE